MKAPRSISTILVLGLVAGLLVTGVVVASAHGGAPSRRVIHACVDNKTGDVWIVRPNDRCGQHAHPLNWNGRGPRGPQGPPGPSGQPGDTFVDIEVVTKTAANFATGSTPQSLTVGVGVDCPGDAVATGGGGHTSDFNTLVSSVPLEANSTSNFAETGDTPTGWWASGSPPSVTVYAVCASDGSPPPDDEDD